MSGTSADGVDAVLMEIQADNFIILASHSIAFTPALKTKIINLFEPNQSEIDRLGELDRELAIQYADCVNQLLIQSPHQAHEIIAIGCHGQTIRHRPNNPTPFTLQIGDANLLAQRTNIDVISDFRKADINQGGQGAPLAPAFHQAAFQSSKHKRFIINIGGIANITHLPSKGDVTGWDTGPGNGLMDSWIQKQKDLPYDHDGQWAASGQISQALLSALLNHPYFMRTPPKSTGKEEFTLHWVEREAYRLTLALAPEDIQATLLELTALSITQEINHVINASETLASDAHAFICGGGAFNGQLINRIQQNTLANVSSTILLGICPMQVEAAAFAWLAHQFNHRLPGNLPAVTGAEKPVVLGSLTPHT